MGGALSSAGWAFATGGGLIGSAGTLGLVGAGALAGAGAYKIMRRFRRS